MKILGFFNSPSPASDIKHPRVIAVVLLCDVEVGSVLGFSVSLLFVVAVVISVAGVFVVVAFVVVAFTVTSSVVVVSFVVDFGVANVVVVALNVVDNCVVVTVVVFGVVFLVVVSFVVEILLTRGLEVDDASLFDTTPTERNKKRINS